MQVREHTKKICLWVQKSTQETQTCQVRKVNPKRKYMHSHVILNLRRDHLTAIILIMSFEMNSEKKLNQKTFTHFLALKYHTIKYT
jgi:hypothetical protein